MVYIIITSASSSALRLTDIGLVHLIVGSRLIGELAY